MFAYIKGELSFATPIYAVVDVSGVGYQIFIPANVFSKLPQIGQPIFVYTSYIVREASHTLYGFLSQSEKDLFEILLGVTGVGPKTALSLIGHLSMDELQKAISNHNIAVISKVPGIGKKTAERLILELRDKLPAMAPSPGDLSISFVGTSKGQLLRDAMSALVNLGYNQITAQKAIKKTMDDFSEEVDLATLITHSLKNT